MTTLNGKNRDAEQTYETVVRDLVQLRTEGGDSQAALAEALGLSQGAVGHYESRRNSVPLKVAVRWAGVYDHTMVVVPAEDGSSLRMLRDRLQHLSDDDLKVLLQVAEALPRLSETMKRLVGTIALEAL